MMDVNVVLLLEYKMEGKVYHVASMDPHQLIHPKILDSYFSPGLSNILQNVTILVIIVKLTVRLGWPNTHSFTLRPE
jgi:hypothetical protein